ncbi:hypothetical protein AQI94_41970 [Streptomyces pseudovenezuelae]|jgi:hypothetical protein|uniref:Uncharacterized protein n=3 Tax=Streptomyces TaxID=1883 RepID=A0A124H8D1_9ACTN|nr:hypothetical protein AQI94_41970 [Streptomyces pseudovenezuelae]
MAGQQLDENDHVTLDASGNGTVTFQPDAFRTWNVTSINVRTTQGVTQTPVPQVTVYLGDKSPGQIVSQSWMGNRATAGGSPLWVQPSQRLIVEWTNGVPGTVATASLFGTMDMRR